MKQGARRKVGARDIARLREDITDIARSSGGDAKRVTLTDPCGQPLPLAAANDKNLIAFKRPVSAQAEGSRPLPNVRDEELLCRAVVLARSSSRRNPHPRWFAVMEAFGLGAASSIALCKRFGRDPHELVSRDWA